MSDIVERLEPNGEAGSVECDTRYGPDGEPYPEPVCQYFAAQAGPWDEGTAVCVLSAVEAGEIAAEIRRLRAASRV